MNKKYIWFLVSCLMVLSLLITSCAPSTSANPTSKTTPTSSAPTVTTTTIVSQTTTTPPATATTSTGPQMVKLNLKKLDGTAVEKLVEKPQYGGELITMRNNAITGWDEAIAQNYSIAGNVDQVLEELMQGDWARGPAGTEEVSWQLRGWFDVNYQIGALAESWELVQPDTITYHIRKGVHWALNPASEASRLVGGREFTADDALFNLRRSFFEIKTSSGYTNAGISRPIDAYAPDKWTLVVKTIPGQIWSTNLYVAQWNSNYPPEVIKKYGDANDWTRCIGTDAFMLTDYVSMSAVTYVRNPNYWQMDPMFTENQLPYVERIKLLIIPDASTRMSAMRTGKVDLDNTGLILWEDAASLKKTNPDLKYSKIRNPNGPLIAARLDKPELPFKDIRVRRALMMAINQQELIDTYYGGEATIYDFLIGNIKEWARAYTPLNELGLAPDGFDTKKIYEYHPEEARQLLAEAGYPNGFKTEVALGTTSVDLASIIKEYWANIGVDLTLDVKESGVLSAILGKKTHNEMYWHGWTSLSLPYSLDVFRTGAHYNPSMVTDPKIAEYYEYLNSVEPRSDEWWKALKEAGVYVNHQVYYTVLPRVNLWYFWQPWLKGYHGEIDLSPYNTASWEKYSWIDQDLKKAMGH